jgi:DNA modification methylase
MPTGVFAPESVQWREAFAGAQISARIAHADWLDAARDLPLGSVDLVYVDPPFNTGSSRADRAGAFEDRWPAMPSYIAWLRERLGATIPLLKPTGSILLHLDWRTSHHARLLLDDLLGADRFVNHLIWRYGLGGSSARRFARKHDDILFYCVDPERYFFQAPAVPATSRRMAGKTKKATDVLDVPALGPGAEPWGDVLDIPSINNMSHERTGWPTQKPLALLELLVSACCPAGGTVFDPCCGSGVALLAAMRLGRDAIGSDAHADAVEITVKRLASLPSMDRPRVRVHGAHDQSA